MICCCDEYVHYDVVFPISSAFLIITARLNLLLYKNIHFHLRKTSNETLKKYDFNCLFITIN